MLNALQTRLLVVRYTATVHALLSEKRVCEELLIVIILCIVHYAALLR
jgi:hypothetical protein